MTLAVTPNVSFPAQSDRMGALLMKARDLLVGSGLWKVRGSGDGRYNAAGGAMRWEGKTAPGPGGSFDVFTEPALASMGATDFGAVYKPNCITNPSAWLVLQEVGSTRSWLFQRSYGTGAQSEAVWIEEFSPGGYDGTNCTNGVPPVPIGPFKTLWATRNGPAANNAPYVAFSQSGYDLAGRAYYDSLGQVTSTASMAVHFWTATSPRDKGVRPFGWWVVNQSLPREDGGLFYESLTDAPDSEQHPCIFTSMSAPQVGSGLWSNTGYWFGPAAQSIGAEQLSGNGIPVSPPGNRPVDPDGKWRTYRPRIYCVDNGTYRYLGRAEHLIANMVAREYPTTYGVASDTPYLTVSTELILPWKKAVAPAWGP